MAATISSNQDDDPPSLLSLPLEMVVEILCRLPVKSLVRFGCVCKLLQSLVSDPFFVKKHVEMLTTKAENNISNCNSCCDLSLYRIITTCRFHLTSCSLHSLYNDPFISSVEHDHQLIGRDYYHLVGSCNGLICLHTDYRTLFLWNPSIGSFTRLPDSGIEMGSGGFVTYGFGYEKVTGDYKVVAVVCHRQRTSVEQVKEFSMRYNCWRSIGGFPPGIIVENKSAVYVNGAVNWVGTCLGNGGGGGDGDALSRSSSSSSAVIVSYDLSSSKYQEVVQWVCESDCFALTLGAVGGCLCMVCYCCRRGGDVWVMKEYGDKESWSKLVSIPGLLEYAKPLWISRNGEILLELRSGLALYNSKYDAFQYLLIDGLSSSRDAKLCVESLVSPCGELGE